MRVYKINQLVWCFTLFLLPMSLQAQLKLGYESKTIADPKVTLLELSVNPDATFGKAFKMPVITGAQKRKIVDYLGPTGTTGVLPTGMVVFDKDKGSLSITHETRWVDIMPIKSVMVSVTNYSTSPNPGFALKLDAPISPNTVTYTLSGENGRIVYSTTPKSSIVYNHVKLKGTTDFDAGTAPIGANNFDYYIDARQVPCKITFRTLIPESFEEFDEFIVEITPEQ